jgi:prepilin-type N-terminal cleavage/methylation domain-containing protein
MPKNRNFRSAFTLIEVMVAVMIVSVVIAALLHMRGDASNKLLQIKEMIQTNQYDSFLLSIEDKYGFEKSSVDMYTLVEDFDLESDLRRRLKAIKVKLNYDELQSIDTNELEESDSQMEDNVEESMSGIVFEIGKSSYETESFNGWLIRVRLQ